MSLEKIYRNHHKKNRGQDFVIFGHERGDFLKANIGEGKKVLDVGCRDGELTSYYSKNNDVLGLDIDKESLIRANKKLGISIKHVDLNSDWGVPEESFDFIVMAEVVEHLYFPETVLLKAKKSLKPGGKIMITIPNAFNLKNRIRLMRGVKAGTPLADPTHINHFSHREFIGLLSKHFSKIEYEPIGRYKKVDKFWPGMFSFIIMFSAEK